MKAQSKFTLNNSGMKWSFLNNLFSQARGNSERDIFPAADQSLPPCQPETRGYVRGKITELLPITELPRIHQLIATLFPSDIPPLYNVKRLIHFLKNFQKLTKDPVVLNMAKRHHIPFTSPPKQSDTASSPLSLTKRGPVDQEVRYLLRKGAISNAKPVQEQFLSSVFQVNKKDPKISLMCTLK